MDAASRANLQTALVAAIALFAAGCPSGVAPARDAPGGSGGDGGTGASDAGGEGRDASAMGGSGAGAPVADAGWDRAVPAADAAIPIDAVADAARPADAATPDAAPDGGTAGNLGPVFVAVGYNAYRVRSLDLGVTWDSAT